MATTTPVPLTDGQLQFLLKLVENHIAATRQMPGDHRSRWASRLADLLTEAIRTSDDT